MVNSDNKMPSTRRLALMLAWLGFKLYLLYLFASPDGAVPVYQGF